MALAPFFSRVAAAAGGNLSISRESLEERLRDVVPTVETDGLTDNSRWCAEMAVSLFSRIYPRICVIGDSKLSDLALSINPEIELSNAPGMPDHRVICGSAVTRPEAIVVGASGWLAEVGLGSSVSMERSMADANPYSAGAAACVAAAEVFRRVFGLRRMNRSFSLSLLDYGPESGSGESLPAVHFDNVAFVGLGAVAHGLLWGLARHEARSGTIHVVDDEKVDLSNLQRYSCATMKDVGQPKTRVAAQLIEAQDLSCTKHAKSLSDFAKNSSATALKTVCVSVDNIEARRAVQAMLPRLVLNGYTGIGSLGVSWHEMDSGLACLACLYHPTRPSPSYADMIADAFGLSAQRVALLLASDKPLEQDELKRAAVKLGLDPEGVKSWAGKPLRTLYVSVICGGADIPIPSRGRSEVVPLAHQSALAGVLLGAELVKRTNPELCKRSQAVTLAAWHNIASRPPTSWVEPRAPIRGCICGDQVYVERYRAKWRGHAAVD